MATTCKGVLLSSRKQGINDIHFTGLTRLPRLHLFTDHPHTITKFQCLNENLFKFGLGNRFCDTMKKILLVVVILGLIVPGVCLADEMSDAEDAINDAQSMLDSLNSMGFWFGPSAAMKMEAENHLQMALDAFEAGNYSEALQYAQMALQYAQSALGLRGFSMLPGSGLITGSTAAPVC
jgi:hypothetical protein